MKKKIVVLISLLVMLSLSSCGNDKALQIIKYGSFDEIESYFAEKLDNYERLNNSELENVMNGVVYYYPKYADGETWKLITNDGRQTRIQDYPNDPYPVYWQFHIEDDVFYTTDDKGKNDSTKTFLLAVSKEEGLYLACYDYYGETRIGGVITKDYYER